VVVTLADLRAAPSRVTRLARRRGGVRVVDEHGRDVFRLWIPNTPLED
jgi:hypothetical protein